MAEFYETNPQQPAFDVAQALNNYRFLDMVSTVMNGITDKCTTGPVTVYKCGTVLRVDVKGVFKK